MATASGRPWNDSTGLTARELRGAEPTPEVVALVGAIADDGGQILTVYREPFAGRWVVLAALPLDALRPVTFQRELSAPHARRLARAISTAGCFLDPLVAFRDPHGYWTPNGLHRLEAMRLLGARSVPALVLSDRETAWQILALNTEMAPDLRDRSIQVVRLVRELETAPDSAQRPERTFARELAEAAHLTLGLCYEVRPRFAGSLYLSVLRRCDGLGDAPIVGALERRVPSAAKLLALDDAVAACVHELRRLGVESPGLRAFIVGQLQPEPLPRWSSSVELQPSQKLDGVLTTMLAAADRLDPHTLGRLLGEVGASLRPTGG